MCYAVYCAQVVKPYAASFLFASVIKGTAAATR